VQAGWRWDAFLTTGSRPLQKSVSSDAALSWRVARTLLQQLTEELIAATADETLPDRLGADQVWIQPGGDLLLLDMPLHWHEEDYRSRDTVDRCLDMVGETAILALEGSPRPEAGRVRAPLPDYTIPLFARLFRYRKPFRDLEDLHRVLSDLSVRPAEVTRARQARRIAMVGSAVLLGMCCILPVALGFLSPTGLTNLMAGAELNREARSLLTRLEKRTARDVAKAVLLNDPIASTVALDRLKGELEACADLQEHVRKLEGDYAHRKEAATWLTRVCSESFDDLNEQNHAHMLLIAGENSSDQTGQAVYVEAQRWILESNARAAYLKSAGPFLILQSVLLLLICPIIWTASAVACRGGLSYILTGLALVRPDGHRAGRLRCGARAALAWSAPTLLLLSAVTIDAIQWWQATPQTWLGLVSEVLRWLGLALLLIVYPILAIVYPQQGPHDRLVGTVVVPQ
jgi:hypothetical protein